MNRLVVASEAEGEPEGCTVPAATRGQHFQKRPAVARLLRAFMLQLFPALVAGVTVDTAGFTVSSCKCP